MKKLIAWIIAFVVTLALIFGISWITTCGLVYLITLCFGWEFNWLIATGIWLILILISSAVKANINVKK